MEGNHWCNRNPQLVSRICILGRYLTTEDFTDVYDYPKVLNITVLPNTSIITVGSNISLLCWIKAPFKGTIVEWRKNGNNTTLKHIVVEQENEILSNITIVNATQEDNGNYSCRCYYNRSIITSRETISSNTDTILLLVKGKATYTLCINNMIIII